MSKPIYKDNKVDYERWQAPNVNAPAGGSIRSPQPASTAKQLTQLQQQAYDEGFAAGHRDGLVKGIEQGKTQLQQMLTDIGQSMQAIDEDVVDELAQFALAISKQILRREIKIDPGEVIAVVREAVSLLMASSSPVNVFLHPEDAVLVREALTIPDGQPNWTIVEDPGITRGGCKVSTDVSYIDATMEARIAEIGAQILGGERASDV